MAGAEVQMAVEGTVAVVTVGGLQVELMVAATVGYVAVQTERCMVAKEVVTEEGAWAV